MGCFQAPVIKDYVSVLCSSGGVLCVHIVRYEAIYLVPVPRQRAEVSQSQVTLRLTNPTAK